MHISSLGSIIAIFAACTITNAVHGGDSPVVTSQTSRHLRDDAYWPNPFTMNAKEVVIGLGTRVTALARAENIRLNWATSDHYRAVGELDKIVRISLSGEAIESRNLSLFRRICTLRTLDLSSSVSDRDLTSQLTRLRQIRHLDLSEVRVSVRDLDRLAKLPLQSLSLRVCRLDLVDVLSLSPCRSLRYLDVSGLRANRTAASGTAPGGIQALDLLLSRLPNLRELRIAGLRLKGDELPSLRRHGSIRSLDISSNPLSDSGFAAIGQIQSLQNLRISNPPGANRVLRGELRSLMPLCRLRWLDVSGWGITPKAANCVSMLRLDGVTMSESLLSRDAIIALSKSESLTYLDLSHLRRRISEFGVNKWPGMDSMGEVMIRAEDLVPLTNLKRVHTIITHGNLGIHRTDLEAIKWPRTLRVVSH